MENEKILTLKRKLLNAKGKMNGKIFKAIHEFTEDTGCKVVAISSDYDFECLSIFVYTDADKEVI